MKKKLLYLAGGLLLAASSFGLAANLQLSDFSEPVGLLEVDDGALLVAEWGGNRLTRVDPSGKRQTVLGGIASPAGMVKDNAGNIYIAGYGDGQIYIWNGKGEPQVLARGFQQPTGLLWSGANSLLVANRGAGTVEEVDGTGKRRVVSRGHNLPVGIARTESGDMYVSCYGGTLDRVSADGVIHKIDRGIQRPGVGIVAGEGNRVYVVDNGAGAVLEAGPDGAIRTLAKGLSSPVGLARTSGKGIIVSTWGDGKIRLLEAPNE